jgi:hypothetical protein
MSYRIGESGSNGNGKKRGPKPKYATEDRREKIRWYRQNGVTKIADLARQIGVHRNTITADLKAIQDDDRRRVSEGDAHQIIGETDGTLAQVEEELMATYHSLPKSACKERMDILKEVRNTRLSRIKLLFDTGALPRIQNTEDWNVATEYRSMETSLLTQRTKKLMAELSADIGDVVPEHPEPQKREVKTSYKERWTKKQREMEDGVPVYPPPPPARESAEDVRKAFGGEPPIVNPPPSSVPDEKKLVAVGTEDDTVWWTPALRLGANDGGEKAAEGDDGEKRR